MKNKGVMTAPAGGVFNIASDYRWTLSKHQNRKDVPYIWLQEFNANESQIQKQISFYTQLIPSGVNAAAGIVSSEDPLDIYKEIFPHTDTDNCYQYILPYFNDTNLELSTPTWPDINDAGEVISQGISNTFGGIAGMFGADATKFAAGTKAALAGIGNAALLAATAQYPVVGELDRPRVFQKHSERTITVSFPLFNTVDSTEWEKNQNFVHTLMNQNLMYKTNYITGVPPVFYSVFIPGQYYCWASCVTNLNVKNLGNMRMMGENTTSIVPDAYEITISFSEMVQPSKNQFDARYTGESSSGKVNVSLLGTVTQVGKDLGDKVGRALGL